MKKESKNSKERLVVLLPYGVALGAIMGMLLAFISDNVAYLVYGIIIGLFMGFGICTHLLKKEDKPKKK